MSVLIKGGRIITAADNYVADVYVEDERVTLIGESLDTSADKVIDASGKYVLPGLVDPHTHLDMPFGGTVTIDDVESGQTAAAFGGTTTHVDFCFVRPGTSIAQAIEQRAARWKANSHVDYAFHITLCGALDLPIFEQIPDAIAEGSFFQMQTFEQALISLVLSGDVDREIASAAATNQHDFIVALEQALKRQAAGITKEQERMAPQAPPPPEEEEPLPNLRVVPSE
jgi:dihydroorotase-like cyclic amidohydrolase